MARVYFPLPDRDFDVTEVAVPWKLLRDAGHEPVFLTENGAQPEADPLLLRGVLFGQLGAEPEPKAFYAELCQDPQFRQPLAWKSLESLREADGVFLAGGHAPGMKQYLGSAALQALLADFWQTGRPLAAICHGVLPLARAQGSDGRSLLYGRRTTCLPRYMERTAYWLTAWKLGRYYRTYPAYVEQEVRASLARPEDFERGPRTLLRRGTACDDRGTFIVEDRNYLSARWPGDAYRISRAFATLLQRATQPARETERT